MAKLYPLAPSGVCWTIQGEGALLGEPMAFIRLAGCSVGCVQCDTDYRVNERVSSDELVDRVRSVVPKGVQAPWVWVTGGEPTDHDLAPLVDLLRASGYLVALATSGVRAAPRVDWLSVSPHSGDLIQRSGTELKVVPGLNGLTWDAIEELSRLSFPYRFVQPIWFRTSNGPEMDGAESRRVELECLEFVRTHPGWRMGIQAHRVWGVA